VSGSADGLTHGIVPYVPLPKLREWVRGGCLGAPRKSVRTAFLDSEVVVPSSLPPPRASQSLSSQSGSASSSSGSWERREVLSMSTLVPWLSSADGGEWERRVS
jgi:hypothetical protein